MSIISLIKKFKYRLEGKAIISPTISIKKSWIGNVYGGFYINLDSLNKESIIYSVGIGEDVSFDLELIDKIKCNIYPFDPTPKAVNFVERNISDNRFIFSKFGLSNISNHLTFYLPKNDKHVSGSLKKLKTVSKDKTIQLEFKTLSDIMKMFNHDTISLLKMDIEGAEYDIISDILDNQIQIKQMVVEFHPQLIEDGKSKTQKIIKDLFKAGYDLFAVSNNYCEYSFIKSE